MLQNARESSELKVDKDRLSTDMFQQVVIDPENFSRFNDGIVQAAILRAARDSELDYSSHEDASRRMVELLSRVFRAYARDQGEAALEFAFALYSRRIKLSKKAMELLQQEFSSIRLSGSGYLGLLNVLVTGSFPSGNRPSASF